MICLKSSCETSKHDHQLLFGKFTQFVWGHKPNSFKDILVNHFFYSQIIIWNMKSEKWSKILIPLYASQMFNFALINVPKWAGLWADFQSDRVELRPQNSFTLPYSGSLQVWEEQEGGKQLHNLFMFNLLLKSRTNWFHDITQSFYFQF